MKNLKFFLAFLFVAHFAQAVDVPWVRCEMSFSDNQSTSINATTGTGANMNMQGFTLNARLEGMHAGCAVPTLVPVAYSLILTLSDATHSSMTTTVLHEPMTRYSMSMKSGDKTAMVSCDHT